MSVWRQVMDGIQHWPPVLQGMGVSALTFVSEDATTLASAALARAGLLHWSAAFLGCFLGIWIGDLALYAVARRAGDSLRQWNWARRRVTESRWQQSERWIARHGAWCLLMTRWIPGTRLVTFLMAGFLRMPVLTFSMTTGLTAVLWTTLWFVAFDKVSERFQSNALPLGLMFGGLVAITFLLKRAMDPRRIAKSWGGVRTSVERLCRWEFWPAWMFYLPLMFRIGLLMIRFRGISVPCSANPGMYLGGLVGESKYDILKVLHEAHPGFTAATWLIEPGDLSTRMAVVQQHMKRAGLRFPIVLKPDVGQRGAGFKRVSDAVDVEQYLTLNTDTVLLQEYAPGPFEAGVFYIRYPGESQGRIFAITDKRFPTLVGDGVRTLRECIAQDPRARFQQRILEQRFEARLDQILAPGELVRLVEAGNHAQGCEFRDGMHWWTAALEQRIDTISKSHPGFHFGRYDIRFQDESEWRMGMGFKIVELNGVSAEATSLYDARNSLIDAYRILFEQWRHAFAIGALHRQNGVPVPALSEIARAWMRDRRQTSSRMIAD